MSRIGALVLAGVFLATGGCLEDPEAASVRDTYQNLGYFGDQMNGAKYASLITRSSFRRYDTLIEHALSSKADDVRQLSALDRLEILMMRNQIDRDVLQDMNGREFVIYAADQGWYAADPDDDLGVEIGTVNVKGPTATGMLVVDGSTTIFSITFRLEDGVWKMDEGSWAPFAEDIVRQVEEAFDMSTEQAILQMESFDYGLQRSTTDLRKPMNEWR